MEENTGEHSLTEQTPDPWLSSETVIKELELKKRTVDYAEVIGDSRVLFFGERHTNSPIREHISKYAEQLKTNGITHYGIEASEVIRDVTGRINNGEDIDLTDIHLGPFGGDNYEVAIRAMAAQGIKIVPIDIDQTAKPDKVTRELHITNEIKKILNEDEAAKIAVLIGAFHTSKGMPHDGNPYVGRRLMDEGIATVTVMMTGGTDSGPTGLLNPVRDAGLANEEFMMEMREYKESKYVPFGSGETDYIVHLPEQVPTQSGFGGFNRSW